MWKSLKNVRILNWIFFQLNFIEILPEKLNHFQGFFNSFSLFISIASVTAMISLDARSNETYRKYQLSVLETGLFVIFLCFTLLSIHVLHHPIHVFKMIKLRCFWIDFLSLSPEIQQNPLLSNIALEIFIQHIKRHFKFDSKSVRKNLKFQFAAKTISFGQF